MTLPRQDQRDRIDYVIETLRELQDLQGDPAPMGVLIRMGRIYEVVEQMLESVIRNQYVRHKKDHDLLVVLLQARKPLRNKQLERILHITSPSVSQRVARLMKTGMIDRSPSPDDTRANELTLTELGRKVTIANVEKAINVQKAILESSFSKDEVETMEHLLRRLNRSLGDTPAREQVLASFDL